MDDRENGHGRGDFPLPAEARERLRAARAAADAATSSSLRAGEQMARLEARIRDFHRNLEALDAAEASVEDLTNRASGGGTGSPAAQSQTPPVGARRIDTLRSEARPDAPVLTADGRARLRADPDRDAQFALAEADARALADRIQADAERRAEQTEAEAEATAEQIRRSAEHEMSLLWQALEGEVEAIQAEISRRVDRLAERIETAGAEAEQVRARAEADAAAIRQRADHDAHELMAVAEQEAQRFVLESRRRTPTHREPDPERGPGERLAEQIREATAAVTRRVGLISEDWSPVQREPRDPVVPETIMEIIDGLASAVSLIERSLTGLSDLLGETLGSERR